MPTAPTASRSSASSRRSATRRSSTRSARPARPSRSSSPASTSPATSAEWEAYKPADPLNALAAGWNDFDYAKNLRDLQATISRESPESYPIVVGGFGDTDCNSDYSTKLMKFADGKGISYLAWTWNTEADYGGCSNALLGPKRTAYFTGHPSGFGKGIRKHYRAVKHG